MSKLRRHAPPIVDQQDYKKLPSLDSAVSWMITAGAAVVGMEISRAAAKVSRAAVRPAVAPAVATATTPVFHFDDLMRLMLSPMGEVVGTDGVNVDAVGTFLCQQLVSLVALRHSRVPFLFRLLCNVPFSRRTRFLRPHVDLLLLLV